MQLGLERVGVGQVEQDPAALVSSPPLDELAVRPLPKRPGGDAESDSDGRAVQEDGSCGT
jgi:hypothetical protein